MFNLEKSVNDWKARLNENNTLTNDDVCELESHMLDEINSLILKNLSEEEAFIVASHRLGSTAIISDEFTKVNHKIIWLNKLKWFLSGFILLLFIQNLITDLSTGITCILYNSNVISMNYVTLTSLLVNTVLLVMAIIILFSSKFSSFITTIYSKKRVTLYIILGLLTFMNCIGFNLIAPIYTRFFSVQLFGQSSLGSSYFMIIWIIALSIILFSLQKKNILMTTTK